MPMLSDLQMLEGALARKRTRAYLLVFVTPATNSRDLWKVMNDFNYDPETRRRRVDIFFPILPAPQEPTVEKLWRQHNPERITPLTVVLGAGGCETAIRIEGVATLEQLAASLRQLDDIHPAKP